MGRGAASAEGGGCPLPNKGGFWLKIVHFGGYSGKAVQHRIAPYNSTKSWPKTTK